jgi:putative ABC transport system permease protein
MWRNYLTVGFRALLKNKTYAFINIFGLALGLAACLLILVYVRYETSFDAWIPNAEHTYQLQQSSVDTESGNVFRFQGSSYVAGRMLQKDFPQVEKLAYLMPTSPIILQDGRSSAAENFAFTDSNFLEVVELPLLDGDAGTALGKPGSLVMTQEEAVKRFGTEKALGRTLTLSRNGVTTDYRVTGILVDLPRNSHLDLAMIARFDPKSYWGEDAQAFETGWGFISGSVYLRLKPGADPSAIGSQMAVWEKRNIATQEGSDPSTNIGNTDDWHLVNIRDVHLGEAQEGGMTPGNDRTTITTFTIVAVLILALACINFVNLATARASQRAREIALRKVLGATRRQLITQFLGESLVVTALAMILAVAIAELVLPALAGFLESDLRLDYLGEHGMLSSMLLLLVFVAAAGGIYPAFYLSRFQPASVLKANKSASDTRGSGRVRTSLVVAQFAISIGLIVCTAVIYSQTLYAQTVDPGYRRDGLLQLQGFGRSEVDAQAERIAREIEKVKGVTAVGRSTVGVDEGGGSDFFVSRPGSQTPYRLFTHRVDTKFFPTMGIDILAGRNFDEAQSRDLGSIGSEASPEDRRKFAERGINIVVNASGAKRLGYADPRSAIGQQVMMPALAGAEFGRIPATIIGVANDARFRSVRDPLEPSVFRYSRSDLPLMEVRYDDADPSQLRERVEAIWKRHVPDVPFSGEFTDEIVAELYQAETARGQIFAGFALLAVIIGCLGLFGLAAYTAERRTKEIGIRKVLGARIRDIVRLLVWQFSKPVMLANLIAWPVAWWVMRDWLNTFDLRIDLGPTPFLAAALIALAIAVATVAGHAIKVARLNPVHALRYE